MEHHNPTHIPTHNHPAPSLLQVAAAGQSAGCPAAAATEAAPTVVTITASLSSQRLMRAEQSILDRLGGTPWKASRATRAQVAAAKTVWNNLRTAVGFQASTTGWFTTSQTSPKMVKNNYPTVGVTMHPHKKALGVWLTRTPAEQDRIAAALGVSTAEVLEVLDHSVCPYSTPGCRCGCVTGESANAKLERSDLTRLNRTLLSLLRPDLACALTWRGLHKLKAKHGTKCRWRVNVSDDIRWELLAPGLFSVGVKGYTYTKFPPSKRAGRPNLSVVYSASERYSDADIADIVAAGHRVAVVFDVPKKQLPATWNGMTVVDGDKTDDLYTHPAGTIVGLAVKGTSKDVKEQMREFGFARPV